MVRKIKGEDEQDVVPFALGKREMFSGNYHPGALKIIALLSMLWDHVTYVWPLTLTVEVLFFPDAAETIPALLVLQRATDYIGRIAAR